MRSDDDGEMRQRRAAAAAAAAAILVAAEATEFRVERQDVHLRLARLTAAACVKE